MSRAWLREERPEVAAERILEAAEKAFVERGVAHTTMATVAEFAGCSRGTLYRYFKNRRELDRAYVNRTARAIVEQVRREGADLRAPRERLVAGMLVSIREVRARPGAAAWFEAGAAGTAARLSRSSDVIEAFASAFTRELWGPGRGDAEHRQSARALVRVIVSLLVMPGEDADEERSFVERFAAAALPPDRR